MVVAEFGRPLVRHGIEVEAERVERRHSPFGKIEGLVRRDVTRRRGGQQVRRQIAVRAQKPADILGVYVYLPGGGA